MFTGIVTEVGVVEAITDSERATALAISAPETTQGLTVGDSVAVNGACLTVVGIRDAVFSVQVVGETIDRTNLGRLGGGDSVNLERPLSGNGRFDGHIVQGHVDGTGHIVGIAPEGEASRVRIAIDHQLSPYVVEKGSITVDGVSLTVTGVSTVDAAEPWFEIVLIPHTLDVTVLGERTIGNTVNLEADILAKYIERMLEMRT